MTEAASPKAATLPRAENPKANETSLSASERGLRAKLTRDDLGEP